MRDCAQERAVVARRVLLGEGGRGVGSWQRRLPRSKVGGMGLVIVMELGGRVLVELERVRGGERGIYDSSGFEAVGAELRLLEEAACGASVVEPSAMMVRRFGWLKNVEIGGFCS